MNAKENALRIIRFDQPERILYKPPTHAIAYCGCNHEGYAGGGHHLPVGSRWTDIWGTLWHKEHDGVMGFPRGNPLADLSALPGYVWPDPDDERVCDQIYQQAQGWQPSEAFLTGSHRDTLWEKGYMLVGMENIMCYMHTDPNAVHELLHSIMDFQFGIAKHYLAVGVEMVTMGDDLGTQRGLLLSRELIERFLVPEYRRLFELYRAEGVLISFHSCGNVTPIIELFLNIGVDILNPVQATANDLSSIRRITQGRMALQGGVNSAVMVSGPPDAIRREAAIRMWQLGRKGGYFCCPDQSMPWPLEHLETLHHAVDQLGRYPLAEPSPALDSAMA